MDREELRQELQDMFQDDTGNEIESMDDTVDLKDGLGLDSLDIVSLVMRIEQRYRIRLAHEELAQVATAGQMLDLIQSKLSPVASTAGS